MGVHPRVEHAVQRANRAAVAYIEAFAREIDGISRQEAAETYHAAWLLLLDLSVLSYLTARFDEPHETLCSFTRTVLPVMRDNLKDVVAELIEGRPAEPVRGQGKE